MSERARNYESLILQQLASHGQKPVADSIGVSESAISRLCKGTDKENKLSLLCQMLDQLGLKVVPRKYKCYDPEYINAIFALAKMQIGNTENPAELAE